MPSSERRPRHELLQQALEVVAREGITPRLGFWSIAAATRFMLDHLMGGLPQRASAAAQSFHALYDRTLAHNPPPQPLACRQGCSYCCHSFVAASAPELFVLAEEISCQPQDRVDEALARIEAAHAATAGLDKASRSRLRPCALLVENLCSVYVARPISCRAFASFSVEKCEQAFRTGSDDIPVPVANFQLRGACNQALWSALARVGLPFQSYELTHGLLRVLQTPDAERRWLAGEDVLAGVQVDDVSLIAAEDPKVRLYYETLGCAALDQEPPQNPWL